MDESDAELVQRFRAGDQDAATELYNRHSEQMLLVVRGMLRTTKGRGSFDSHGISHDGFRSFFSAVAKPAFDVEKSNVVGLLRSIVTRKCCRALRRKQLVIGHDPESINTFLEWAIANAHDAEVSDEWLVQCRELMDELREGMTPLQQNVLTLYLDPDGPSLPAIARECDCTLARVEQIIEWFKAELRRRLKDA